MRELNQSWTMPFSSSRSSDSARVSSCMKTTAGPGISPRHSSDSTVAGRSSPHTRYSGRFSPASTSPRFQIPEWSHTMVSPGASIPRTATFSPTPPAQPACSSTVKTPRLRGREPAVLSNVERDRLRHLIYRATLRGELPWMQDSHHGINVWRADVLVWAHDHQADIDEIVPLLFKSPVG